MALSPDNPSISGGVAQPEGQAPVEGQQPQPEGSAPAQPQTPEEVEAIWRNRFSQRDRAHNAEVESLRRQVGELRGTGTPSAAADGTTPAGNSYKAQYEAAQQELEQVRREATVANRRAQFPALAGEIAATDPVWASANEESLARMNALVGAPPRPAPAGPIDQNQPPRTPTGPRKALDQMSKDELLQELARQSPAEAARMEALRNGG